jgi:hypothetical protein
MITRLILNIRDPALAHIAGRLTHSTSVTADPRFAPYRRENQTDVEPDKNVTATMSERILRWVNIYS